MTHPVIEDRKMWNSFLFEVKTFWSVTVKEVFCANTQWAANIKVRGDAVTHNLDADVLLPSFMDQKLCNTLPS